MNETANYSNYSKLAQAVFCELLELYLRKHSGNSPMIDLRSFEYFE